MKGKLWRVLLKGEMLLGEKLLVEMLGKLLVEMLVILLVGNLVGKI